MTPFWRFGRLWGRGAMTPPGGVDCEGVVRQLYEYIDEELDAETIAKIRRHLEACQKCFPRYDFERAFLRFLAEHGRSGASPELRRRVFETILEEESRG